MAAPVDLQNINAVSVNDINYENLLHTYRTHNVKWYQGSGRLFKSTRCEFVAKKIAELLGELQLGDPDQQVRSQAKRLKLTKVLKEKVMPTLGAQNSIVALATVTKTSIGSYLSMLTRLQRTLNDVVGQKNNNVQWYTKQGANDGAVRDGHGSIWAMSYSSVQRSLSELATIEKQINDIPEEQLEDVLTTRDDLKAELVLAKTQLEHRRLQLETLAQGLSGRLISFKSDAREPALLSRLIMRKQCPNRDPGAALAITKAAIERDLDLVEDLYKGLKQEQRDGLKIDLARLQSRGSCPRTRAKTDDLRDRPASLWQIGTAGVAALATAAVSGSQNAAITGVGSFLGAATSGPALVAAGAVFLIHNYMSGGFVAELLGADD